MKVNEMIFPYESESESTITFELVKRIYDSILDEESKKIFKSRILLSCTQDVSCLKELILSTKYGKKFRSFLEKHQNGIYVYGAGIRGKRLVNIFSNINWKAYIVAPLSA